MDALMASSSAPTTTQYMTGLCCPKWRSALHNRHKQKKPSSSTCCVYISRADSQLPAAGVNWTGFLVKEVAFDSLDSRSATVLIWQETAHHVVNYSAVADKMVVTLEDKLMFTANGSTWVPQSSYQHALSMLTAINAFIVPFGIGPLVPSTFNVIWWVCLGWVPLPMHMI